MTYLVDSDIATNLFANLNKINDKGTFADWASSFGCKNKVVPLAVINNSSVRKRTHIPGVISTAFIFSYIMNGAAYGYNHFVIIYERNIFAAQT